MRPRETILTTHLGTLERLYGHEETEDPLVEIQIEGDKAIFHVHGWDQLWALRSQLEIPLAHIQGVHADPAPAMGWFHGLKLAGTSLPNVFRAGTFYQDQGLVFWDVHHPENTIVIELADERYRKLIVEVEDPSAAVDRLTRAIGPGRAG